MIYVYGVALPAYFIPRAYGRGIKRDTSVMIYVIAPFICAGLETDRLLARARLVQSQQLKGWRLKWMMLFLCCWTWASRHPDCTR